MSQFDPREPLILSQVHQIESYQSPFEPNVPGFKGNWWDDWGKVGKASRSAFVARKCGEEVARVMTNPHARLYDDQYVDLRPLVAPVEVLRFEVREDLHRSRIGSRVAQRIADQYEGRDLYAFGDTDPFWRAIGWREHPRADGDGLHAPLFVLHQG